MDEQSPGTAPVTKQDLRDLKSDLREEIGAKVDALQWKIAAVAILNVGGVFTGVLALFEHKAAAQTASAIAKAVGIA